MSNQLNKALEAGQSNAVQSETKPEMFEKTKGQSDALNTTENVSMVKTQPDITSEVFKAVVKNAVDEVLSAKCPNELYIVTPYYRGALKHITSASATKKGVLFKNRMGGVEGFIEFARPDVKLAFLKRVMDLMARFDVGGEITADDLDLTEFF